MAANIQGKLPPGPRPLPFFGNILTFQNDRLGFLQHLEQTYGKMATFYFGSVPFVALFRPEYVRYILTENPRNFTSIQSNGMLREVLGSGLLTIEGEAHRQQRRLVQPAFHKKRIENYAEVMVQYTQEMLTSWSEGEERDLANEMQKLTLRIVAKTLFNLDLESQVNELGDTFSHMIANRRSAVAQLLKIRIDAPFTGYGKRMNARRTLDAFIYQLIEQRRAGGQDLGDVLSMLLASQEEGLTLTDLQVRDHVMTLMAAGHETTALALTWTFYLLSLNPTVCDTLLQELQTVLSDRAPTLEDIPRLPYTEWVINESMRIYPPVWTIGRRAREAFELDGYHFPAHTVFTMSQWVLHRLPSIWGDPEVFRPERWDPANGQKIPPWSYFPFGGGPRICIGMPFAQLEAKLLLATILQRYTFQVAPNYKLELVPLVTLRPKYGLPVKLERIRRRSSDFVQ